MRANTQTARTKPRPPVRVRHLPPTIEEAVFAAQGLTDDVEQQAGIAAELMGVALDDSIVALVRKASAPQRRSAQQDEVTFSVDRSGAHRAVVVERRPSFAAFRKPVAAVDRSGGATVERVPFRGASGGQTRTLIRLGGAGR